jgi:hypothetical protein
MEDDLERGEQDLLARNSSALISIDRTELAERRLQLQRSVQRLTASIAAIDAEISRRDAAIRAAVPRSRTIPVEQAFEIRRATQSGHETLQATPLEKAQGIERAPVLAPETLPKIPMEQALEITRAPQSAPAASGSQRAKRRWWFFG